MGKVLKSVAIAAVIIGIGVATGGIGFAPAIGATTATVAGVTVTTAAVVGSSLAFTAFGAALATMAVTTVLSGVSAQLFGPKMPKAQMSRLNPTLEPQAHRKFVFGETAMNTDVRYYETSGTDQEYFDYIIATSAHEVESIDEIWFDDQIAWSSSGGVASFYSGYLTIDTRLVGTSANAISINGGGIWGSSCRLTGCSYIYLRLKRTGNDKKAESPLVNGLPGRVTIKGKGAKLYDPRLDSTVTGGSGSHRANNQTTWGTANSTNRDNPALQLLWFLLGWNINSKLSVGCGIPYQRIDLPSFITAANICDESITLAAGGTQPRYRTAGVGSDADARMEIIQILLSSMNATLRDSNGKLSLTVMKNDLATPVLSFDDDDILGDFSWNQTRGLDEMMNAVHGKYTDPSNNSLYQSVEYPTISITSIDGIERMQTFDIPWVQEGRRAQRIAKQVLQRAQYKGIFSASFTMKALGCEVGDIVYISFIPLGWTNKPFRVLSQGISNSGQIPLTMIEENVAIYAWDAEEEAVVTPTAPTVYDPLNSPYIIGISDAQALADGKITSFYQASAPTAEGIGDIWIDTDDANKLYRWSGSAWVLSRDTGITTAIGAAATAQATANGKVVTFYTTSTPTAEAVGDLWYNSSNSLFKRWNGSAWLDVSNNYTNTNQLTDGAGLGTTAIWNNVSGSGKPQDSATRNVSRGAWATSISYVIGDIVSYNGSSYTCILAHTSSGANTPPNGTYWNLLAQAGSTPTRTPQTVQITAIGTSGTIGVGLADTESVPAEAYLNYINLTGGATVTIKIQYSTDGSSWADLTSASSGTGTTGEDINIDAVGTYTNSSGASLFVQFRAITTKTGAGSGTISGSFLRS